MSVSRGMPLLELTHTPLCAHRENTIVGRAIVVHALEDDLGLGGDEESKKTGNAGARVGCGLIELSQGIVE